MKTALEIALARSESLEPIPPITDPMGHNWEQPDRRKILVDDAYALMDCLTFSKLAEYSATNPTGVYPGKMWKRHDGVFDAEFRRRGGKPIWLLCWYGNHPNPNLVSNNYREILLADGCLPGEDQENAA